MVNRLVQSEYNEHFFEPGIPPRFPVGDTTRVLNIEQTVPLADFPRSLSYYYYRELLHRSMVATSATA
jgi:hypothetical protein